MATGAVNSRPYLASEWVEGGTLAAWIGGRPRPWREVVGVVRMLAGAVHHAHVRGVVHRDLKPANVLLRNTECKPGPSPLNSAFQPTVADFGIARLLWAGGLMSVSGQMLGTPAYMPPEQVEGRHRAVGPPSDVYSLGAILYESLTGRPPFASTERLEVFRRILSEPPTPPDAVADGIPTGVAEVCLRCLAKDTKDRFPTAAALGEALGNRR